MLGESGMSETLRQIGGKPRGSTPDLDVSGMRRLAQNRGSPAGNTETIYREWERFVSSNGIDDPGAYLDAVRMEPFSLGAVLLGTTSSCNLSCAFCYLHAENEFNAFPRMTIPRDEFVEFCRKNTPLKEIVFTMYGEPLMYRGLLDVMEEVTGVVGGFAFNTNALLLDEAILKRLAALPINRVAVSVEASDKETYEAYRCKGRFETLVKNVAMLAEALGERLILNSTVSKGNAKSVVGMPAFFARLGVGRFDVQTMVSHADSHAPHLQPLDGTAFVDFAAEFVQACRAHDVSYSISPAFREGHHILQINERLGFEAVSSGQFSRKCTDPMRTVQFDPAWNFAFCCAHQLYPARDRAPLLHDIINIDPVLMNRAMLFSKAPPSACRTVCYQGTEPRPDIGVEKVIALANSVRLQGILELFAIDAVPPVPAGSRVLLWPEEGLSRTEALGGNGLGALSVVACLDARGEAMPPDDTFDAICCVAPSRFAAPARLLPFLRAVHHRRLWRKKLFIIDAHGRAHAVSPQPRFARMFHSEVGAEQTDGRR